VNNNDLRSFDFPAPNSADAGEYKSHTVFWLGEGPGVVLMHELPGLTDYVANFGREIATRGYSVFMPVMFGQPFPSRVARSVNECGICVNHEFALLEKGRSSPITEWLRGLCREVHGRCGGPGVGAIGLCLSGGFVLSLMVDKSVLAPVMSEPALPLALLPDFQAALGVSPDELKEAAERSRSEDIPVMGLRFSHDWICPLDALRR
jgi:dienelactone hydrolase